MPPSVHLGRFLASLLLALICACGGQSHPEEEITEYGSGGDSGDDEGEGSALDTLTAVAGEKAEVTAGNGLNLRTAPTTASVILAVMPHGAVVDVISRAASWFTVIYDGEIGWAHGRYLEGVPPPGAERPSDHVGAAIRRARSGLGFSYHWGGGCWNPESDAFGSCYGNCPSCSHEGTWGADCSGYVSKVWQIPDARELTECSHPYNTAAFYTNQAYWRDVPRSRAQTGDAFVRRGHMFLYDGGDAWGSIRAFEAKGCRHGIVYNSRTADSSYKVIRRNGY